MTFPNFKNKHLNEAMFSPNDFLDYRKKQDGGFKIKPPEGIIFCYSRKFLKYVLTKHKTSKVESPLGGYIYFLKETKNKIGLVGEFGIGGPVTAALFEELIAFGTKKFISVGDAGTLQKNIKVQDLVVCDRAIRDEGTSHHYLKPSKYAYAPKKMTEKLKKVLDAMNEKYIVGTSWTIDAIYRETIAEAKQYQKEGVATVDMEAAALFAVAEIRKVELASLFTISDSLADLVWNPKFHLSKNNWETLFLAAQKTLLE